MNQKLKIVKPARFIISCLITIGLIIASIWYFTHRNNKNDSDTVTIKQENITKPATNNDTAKVSKQVTAPVSDINKKDVTTLKEKVKDTAKVVVPVTIKKDPILPTPSVKKSPVVKPNNPVVKTTPPVKPLVTSPQKTKKGKEKKDTGRTSVPLENF